MPNTAHNGHAIAQRPCAALRPFIRRFLVIDDHADHRDLHLPDTGAFAAFSYRGRCRVDDTRWISSAVITGLRETVRIHDHVDHHSVVIAAFTPVGANAFLRPPLEVFSNATVDLEGLLAGPDDLARLQERLASAPDRARRVALVEAFLLARLRTSEPDPLVSAAVDWLQQERDETRIEALVEHIGLSQSALERRFRRVVGISPKRFASVARLRRAVRLRLEGADSAAAALGAGYFDQSHFINAFRRATGQAPEAFLAAGVAV